VEAAGKLSKKLAIFIRENMESIINLRLYAPAGDIDFRQFE
jgi:hypothetical protein